MTSRRSLARAGLIVTGAFLAARVLGWVRLLVISTTFGAGPELDAFFAAFRIPDLIFQLVAAGALGHGPHPGPRGAVRAGRDVARLARDVDGGEPHAPGTRPARGRRLHPGPVDHPGRHSRLRPGAARPDGPADARHAAEPHPARAGLRREQRAQRAPPLPRSGDGADRLQPRDHRGGAAASRRSSGSWGSPSASSSARRSTSPSRSRRSTGTASGTRPASTCATPPRGRRSSSWRRGPWAWASAS